MYICTQRVPCGFWAPISAYVEGKAWILTGAALFVGGLAQSAAAGLLLCCSLVPPGCHGGRQRRRLRRRLEVCGRPQRIGYRQQTTLFARAAVCALEEKTLQERPAAR